MVKEPSKCALLVIDVQQGLFEKSTKIYKAKELLEKISSLVSRARAAGAPVFFIQHSDDKGLVMGSAAWQLHAHLRAMLPELILHKRHGNAFEDTGLDEQLKQRGIESVAICGLVTHGCIRASCLGALALGYRVILVEDAHSSYSKKAAELIQDWNKKLADKGAKLMQAEEVFE